jgi:hypothetical protein
MAEGSYGENQKSSLPFLRQAVTLETRYFILKEKVNGKED